MLDLRQYSSLGAALRDALDRWPNETCLIEADRDREKVRLTYSDFKEMARPLCRALGGRRLQGGRPRGDHHDESVKVADFGVRYFFLRGHAGSAGLQIERFRASAIAGAFEGAVSGGRILLVAGDHAVAEVWGTVGGDCAGDGGAGGCGPAGRLPLGGIQAEGRSAVCGAAAGRPGLYRVLVGDRRSSQGMCADA